MAVQHSQSPKRRRRSKYAGCTIAFSRYHEGLWATTHLLEAGLFGLMEKGKPIQGVLAKLQDIKGLPGKKPRHYKPDVSAKRTGDNFTVTMDVRSAFIVQCAMKGSLAKHKALRFHFYSVLVVYVWGMYETYVAMLLEELYRLKPELLKSNEVLTYKEVITHKDDVVAVLLYKQLDKLGHLTLSESLKYLNDRLSYRTTPSVQAELAKFYLVRNIVAHSTGLVRLDQRKQLPSGTSAHGKDLRITMGFLKGMIKRLEAHVTRIERHVEKKFYRKG